MRFVFLFVIFAIVLSIRHYSNRSTYFLHGTWMEFGTELYYQPTQTVVTNEILRNSNSIQENMTGTNIPVNGGFNIRNDINTMQPAKVDQQEKELKIGVPSLRAESAPTNSEVSFLPLQQQTLAPATPIAPQKAFSTQLNRLDNSNALLTEDPFEDVDPIEDTIKGPSLKHILPDLYTFASEKAINNTIMVTMIDSGYMDLFFSFYTISHMERYKNFFVIALDESGYTLLKDYKIPVYWYKESTVNEDVHKQSVLITSKEFQKKVTFKLKLIRILLDYNMRLLYMDCDIHLFKNPWTYLNQFTHETVDVVAQRDYSLNSGFMLLFPTAITRELFQQAHSYMLMRDELDQESIIAVLPRFPTLRLHLLPEELFSNGRVFFHQYQFHGDAMKHPVIMMHNNFIVGSECKIYRLREMLYFNYDTDHYYTSSDRNYLIVDAEDERIRTTTYLRQAAYLSHVLNRTLLLPTFPCPANITAPRCNLCRDDVECYKTFRKSIRRNYRDYVGDCCFVDMQAFRTHEKTPKEIKDAIVNNPVYTIEKTVNLRDINSNSVKSKIIYIHQKVNSKTLASSFQPFAKERVLKLSDVPITVPKRF